MATFFLSARLERLFFSATEESLSHPLLLRFGISNPPALPPHLAKLIMAIEAPNFPHTLKAAPTISTFLLALIITPIELPASPLAANFNPSSSNCDVTSIPEAQNLLRGFVSALCSCFFPLMMQKFSTKIPEVVFLHWSSPTLNSIRPRIRVGGIGTVSRTESPVAQTSNRNPLHSITRKDCPSISRAMILLSTSHTTQIQIRWLVQGMTTRRSAAERLH